MRNPNDHVNRGQSSNDVFPSAMHIAAAEEIRERLLPAMRNLQASLERKACEFHDVIKIGRTHLQDAVPMRLGQEFSGYSRQVEAARERVEAALPGIHELAFGGAAVGTGLNALPGFAAAVITEIAQETSIPFREARNHFEAQGARDAVCFLSGALRVYAVSLTKIANDIRWLGCGPRCGIGELRFPAVQPGSSIMPRKVNPVIAESLLMACAQVIGYDATIGLVRRGRQLRVERDDAGDRVRPVASIELLRNSTGNFQLRLVDGPEVDRTRAEGFVD